MKLKNILKSSIILSPTALLPLAVVSCGGFNHQKRTDEEEKQYKSQKEEFFKNRLAKISSVSDADKDKFKKDNPEYWNTDNTVLITDSGSIDDKSFNQSAWEALQNVSYDLNLSIETSAKNRYNSVITPENLDKIEDSIKQAVSKGYKYIVLNGFNHQSHLSNLSKESSFVKQVKENKVVFICVDFAPTEDIKENLKGHVLPILFRTDEAAYMAGYALASYLAYKYPTKENMRTISTFGGIPYPAVTDFIVGLFKGIKQFNTDNPTLKTKTISEKVNLTTGFNGDNTTEVTSSAKAEAVFPVAGPYTKNVFDEFQKVSGGKEKLLIGVDTDQSKAYSSSDANFKPFFTSVLKNIGQSIYNTLSSLYINGSSKISLFPGFELDKSNPDLSKIEFGYDPTDVSKQYVGVANSTLVPSLNTEAQRLLDEAIKYYSDHQEDIKKDLKTFSVQPENGDYTKVVNSLAKELMN